MYKTIISIVAILFIAVLIGWYIYLQNTRFTIVGTNTDIAYKIDKKTGDSWTIYSGRLRRNINLDDNQERERFQTLPIGEKAKVEKIKRTSKSKDVSTEQMIGLWDNELSGNLYNGSSWTIEELIIKVKAIEKDGSIRWNREFHTYTTIQPLTTGTFTIGIKGDSDISSFDSNLVRVDGIPPK